MGGFSPAARSSATLVTGERHIAETPAQRIIPDIEPDIQFALPNASPVTTILKGIRGRKESTQREFGWFFKDEYPSMSSVADATLTAAATTLNVPTGDGARYAANNVIKNRNTGEVFLVTGVTADALTIVRGIGGGAQAMTQGDAIERISSAYEDGADKGTLKSIQETYDFNYTQTIRTPFGWVGRQKYTGLYGGKDPVMEKKFQQIKHNQDLESVLLHGRRHKRMVSGKEQTFTGGLDYFIKTNIWELGSTVPSESQVMKVLESIMTYGDGGIYGKGADGATKWAFLSPAWCSLFDSYARGRLEYRPTDKRIGLKAAHFDTPHGSLVLVRHPLLVGPVHNGLAYILDMNHLAYRYHAGRDTMLREGIQNPGTDGEENEYLTDCGFEVQLEFAHSVWRASWA